MTSYVYRVFRSLAPLKKKTRYYSERGNFCHVPPPPRCCKQAKFGIPVSVEPLVHPLSNFEENNNIIVAGANGNSNLEKQTHTVRDKLTVCI